MTAKILISAITTLALFATCLEGRYHLEATGLRHHRHDRHHQVWNQDLVPRGSWRRGWDDAEDEEPPAIDRQRKERPGVSSSRRVATSSGNDRRGSGGLAHRGRYDTQKRGRSRSEGRTHPHPRRDYYYGKSAPSWRRRAEDAAKARRDERPWRNPSRYARPRDDDDDVDEDYDDTDDRRRHRFDNDDDDDDGYEADDESDEDYYPSRKPHSNGRRNRHEVSNWRDEWRRRVDDNDDDDYDQDYDDYDEKRPYRRRHGKRVDDFDDGLLESKNEVPGRRGARKRDRVLDERPEDLNEVEDDDLWGDAEDDDDYDETDADDFDFDEPKEESSLKAIDELIRKLTAGDMTTTSKPINAPRREHRNVDADKSQSREDRHGFIQDRKTTQHQRPTTHKKTENGSTIATTSKPPAKYAEESVNRVENSSRNDVETGVDKKTVKAKPQLLTQLTKPDSDPRTKSLEQDYEEYENDGSEDVDDAAENEDYKKWPSKKDTDYIDEENAEEIEDDTERPPSTTTVAFPSTTMMRTTTTTTTTTTTPTPPAISTRTFDHRYPRVMNARPRPPILKNFQTTSTTYPPMSENSAYKWRTLGSRIGVNERRNAAKQLNSAEIEVRNLVRYAQQMKKETACRLPKPKVISVRDVYLSPSKRYNPSCTILHRCADDTGCCSPEHTCVPKHVHSVELSFYATGIDGNRFIEKLKFDNHTECQCRPRAPPPPPPPPPTTTMRPCKCPSLFTPRHTPERGCECECRNNQLRCLRQRRGKDYFTSNDQWCIKSEQCTIPPCDFGEYLRMPGRCPLKAERPEKVNYYSNSNARHRV